VAIYLTQSIFPDIVTDITLTVSGGFLTAANNGLETAFISQVSEASTIVPDPRNLNFRVGSDVTVVVFYPTQDQRDTWLLTMNVVEYLRIYPVDATGRVINAYATYLDWNAIKPYVSYAPRQYTCANCRRIQSVMDSTGVDGFSIPVAILRMLMPSNGAIFEIEHYTQIPASTGNTIRGANTRNGYSRELATSPNPIVGPMGKSAVYVVYKDPEVEQQQIFNLTLASSESSTASGRNLGEGYGIAIGAAAGASIFGSALLMASATFQNLVHSVYF